MVTQIDLREAFKQNILLLKAMGLWQFEGEFIYKIYKYIVTCALFFDSTSLIIYVSKNMGVKKVTDTIYSLPGSFEVVLQSILFRKKFQQIKKTMDILQQVKFQAKNKEQEEILRKSIVLSKFVLYSFGGLVFVMIMIWMGIPLTKDEKVLPAKYWIPFDYRLPVLYETLYIFECCCIVLHAFSNVALDTFFATAMVQVGAQCDILCNSIKNIDKFVDSDEIENSESEYNKMEKILIEDIHHYNLISEYSQLVSDAFKEILMVQIICSALMICVSMYELSLSEPGSAHFFQVFLFQISATIEIFLYCWFANEVIIKSEKLFYAAFESRWYYSSKVFKKDLIILIHQVRNPISLYVWNIVPVNLNTFIGLLQKSWSFYVAMKNTQELRSSGNN